MADFLIDKTIFIAAIQTRKLLWASHCFISSCCHCSLLRRTTCDGQWQRRCGQEAPRRDPRTDSPRMSRCRNATKLTPGSTGDINPLSVCCGLSP
ncbi:hypothetical protein CSPX01_00152 [Colletotrichum filicis]|nr:hypothetical protein CSPX01_00152 [Colletotrichum filicis]